jgi:hypothetical protein
MGLFHGRQKVDIEEFCGEFYDSQMSQAEIGGVDVAAVFLDTLREQLVKADPSMKYVDHHVFQRELTALRFELFALAWMHRFKKDQFTVPQSVFTERYLRDHEMSETWDIMGEYNVALAELTTLSSQFQPLPEIELAQADQTKATVFKYWATNNVRDPGRPTEEESRFMSCVARAANRIGADLRRRESVGAKRIAARLAGRLECSTDLNDDALQALVYIPLMLYDGTQEALRSLTLQN